MSVEIYTPTINEVTQAVYNLNATKHLLEWHDWLTGYCGPIMYTGFTEHNPLAHAPRPMMDDEKIEIEFNGIMEFDTPESRKAANAMIEGGIMLLKLIPPDDGIYYMVKTEEINGKKYSFFRPCHPSEKPEEGERLERYEKPLRIPTHQEVDNTCMCTRNTAYGIRTPIPEGSFEQPTVTQHGWGPTNFQFKF